MSPDRRFDRTARLLGEEAMARLRAAKVVVIGLGGVGSFAAEALARAGIGRLVLCDQDRVCVTNLNRQLPALASTVGRPKAEVMAARAGDVAPGAVVEAAAYPYGPDTAERLVGPDVTHVVDCLDIIKAKLHLLARCVDLGIPVVSSMGAGGRLDPTRVRVADLSETYNDLFAKDVRKLLRKKYGIRCDRDMNLPAVFSPEKAREALPRDYDAEGPFPCVCHPEEEGRTCGTRRLVLGTASFVTGTLGLTAASVAIRRIAAGTATPPTPR
jgi:tRNA A37 threonylcarbamoyladenosine dehydratase